MNTPSALSWSVAGAGRAPPPRAAARAEATSAGAVAGLTSRASGRAGRGQQEHAPGVLLLPAHRQERVPLDHDAGGVQRRSEWANVVSRDVIRGQGDVRRSGVVCRVVRVRVGHVPLYPSSASRSAHSAARNCSRSARPFPT